MIERNHNGRKEKIIKTMEKNRSRKKEEEKKKDGRENLKYLKNG